MLNLPPEGTESVHGIDVWFLLMPDVAERATVFAELEQGPVLDHAVPLTSGGGITRWLNLNLWTSSDPVQGSAVIEAMVEDITEQKRAEEHQKHLEVQLRQAQKMESIGRLAGGVAHDFNNLLSSIIGYSELALMKLPEESEARAEIETVRTAGEKAEQLTRQLLAFSRKQVLEPRPLDLNETVNSMLKILSRSLGEDIELQFTPNSGPGVVHADSGQMEQVIMNLAVNARDAMPEGGKLMISLSRAHVDTDYVEQNPEAVPGNYAVLTISDTGTGMSAEVREKIFEPFFTTKDKGKGTGLGLATVYGIVKQHGGHVQVYSEPGSGTTFRIYLPLVADEASTNPESPKTETRHGGSETIFVVDDDRFIRNLILDTLESFGYTLIGAASAEEALQVLQAWNEPVHLLLTDVIMPGMNGRELAEHVMALRPGIRVLYMSGYSGDVIAHRGLLDPDVEYMTKPLTPSRLLKKIREILDA